MDFLVNIIICRDGLYNSLLGSESNLCKNKINISHLAIARDRDKVIYEFCMYHSNKDYYALSVSLNNVFITSISEIETILSNEVLELQKAVGDFYTENSKLISNISFKEIFDTLRRSVLLDTVERVKKRVSSLNTGSFVPVSMKHENIPGVKFHLFNDDVQDIMKNLSLYSVIILPKNKVESLTSTPNDIVERLELQTERIKNAFVWPNKKIILVIVIIFFFVIVALFVMYGIRITNYNDEFETIHQKYTIAKTETNEIKKVYQTLCDSANNKNNRLYIKKGGNEILDNVIAYFPESMSKVASRLYREWGKYGDKMKIIGRYPNFSKYCIGCYHNGSENDQIWIHNLVTGVTRKYDIDVNYGIYKIDKLSLTNRKDRFNIMITDNCRYNYKHLYIINLQDGYCREICWGSEIKERNGIVSSKQYEITYEGDYMCEMEYGAYIYRHYSIFGDVVLLTQKKMQCKGYDEDGDMVAMNIYIDENGSISGNYSAGWFTGYTLSGYQDQDGVLQINATGNSVTSDTRFKLSAKSKGELTGLRYGTGKRHYPLNLTYEIDEQEAFETEVKEIETVSAPEINKEENFSAPKEKPSNPSYKTEKQPEIEIKEQENSVQSEDKVSCESVSDNVGTEDNTQVETISSDETIYQVVEQQPEFPGGMSALMKYQRDNINYPRISRDNNSQGKTYVNFVVNTDGSIQDVEVMRSSGDELLDKEAVRLVKTMPKWNPGRAAGKAVRVRFTLPIVFRL